MNPLADHIPGIDHLVYACSDLKEGMRVVSAQLGTQPVEGGRHSAWGTHNALVGLGPHCYLEIIAPDPHPENPSVDVPGVFSQAGSGALTTWAARVDQLPEHYQSLQSACSSLGALVNGSRQRTDGGLLSWVLTDPSTSVMEGAVPFLIDWRDSDHPASTLGSDCVLRSLLLQHPQPGRLNATLAALGLADLVKIETSAHVRLEAVIESPSGVIHI